GIGFLGVDPNGTGDDVNVSFQTSPQTAAVPELSTFAQTALGALMLFAYALRRGVRWRKVWQRRSTLRTMARRLLCHWRTLINKSALGPAARAGRADRDCVPTASALVDRSTRIAQPTGLIPFAVGFTHLQMAHPCPSAVQQGKEPNRPSKTDLGQRAQHAGVLPVR